MKRLLLLTSLCIAAFVLMPLAAASAEKIEARCTAEGTAVFTPGTLTSIPTSNPYEFHGPAVCETLPGKEVRTGTVEVKGQETLSCAGSLGETEGKGTLTLGALKLSFGVTFFLGTPGSTALVAKFGDGGLAIGSATFLGSHSEEASQCFTPKGARYLEFKVAAVGEL
jgi:hypothetical protein